MDSIVDKSVTRYVEKVRRDTELLQHFLQPPGMASMLRNIETDRKMMESVMGPRMVRLDGFAVEFLKRQIELNETVERLIGRGSVVGNFMNAMGMAAEQYGSLYGPASELAKTLALSRSGLERFDTYGRSHFCQNVAVAITLAEHQSLASKLIDHVAGHSTLRTMAELAPTLNKASPTAPGLLGGLDVTSIRRLADAASAVGHAPIQDSEQEDVFAWDDLSEEQKSTIQDTGDEIAEIIEADISVSPGMIARLNALTEKLIELLWSPLPLLAKIAIVFVVIPYLLNLVSSWHFAHLSVVDKVVEDVPVPSTRGADVVRGARRGVSELGLPVEVIRRLRVIKRQSIPVFDGEGECERPTAYLQLGKVVEIMESAGKWRYIRWASTETNESREGWVRAKCLGKLIP